MQDRLLPDAKSAEDAIEQIVRVNRADHLSELLQRPAQLQCQQLRRILEQDDAVRSPQLFQARFDMMAAAAQARSEGRLLATASVFGQKRPQRIDAGPCDGAGRQHLRHGPSPDRIWW